jgi:hypothetical protein
MTNAGTIRFQHKLLFLANALKQHHVGLEESDDEVVQRALCAPLQYDVRLAVRFQKARTSVDLDPGTT